MDSIQQSATPLEVLVDRAFPTWAEAERWLQDLAPYATGRACRYTIASHGSRGVMARLYIWARPFCPVERKENQCHPS